MTDTGFIPEDPTQWGPVDANTLADWLNAHAPENVRRALAGLIDWTEDEAKRLTKANEALIREAEEVTSRIEAALDSAEDPVFAPDDLLWRIERHRLADQKEGKAKMLAQNAHEKKRPKMSDGKDAAEKYLRLSPLALSLARIRGACARLTDACEDAS